jgi:hypothetical protein
LRDVAFGACAILDVADVASIFAKVFAVLKVKEADAPVE